MVAIANDEIKIKKDLITQIEISQLNREMSLERLKVAQLNSERNLLEQEIETQREATMRQSSLRFNPESARNLIQAKKPPSLKAKF